jgi:hypothetical protein
MMLEWLHKIEKKKPIQQITLQQLLSMVADMIISLWSHVPSNFSSW